MKKEKRLFVIIFSLFLFVLGFVSADNCGGTVECHCGDTLTESQVMWYDLNNCGEVGLNIGSNDLTLDCDNHIIGGTGASNGLFLSGRMWITITNCNIQEFYTGIFLETSSYNNLEGNTLHENSDYGIYIASSNSDLNHFWNNIFMNNGVNAYEGMV